MWHPTQCLFDSNLTFVPDAQFLSEPQEKLIGELKTAIEVGKARERTAAAVTLQKLCESNACPFCLLRPELTIRQLPSYAHISTF